MKKIRFIAIFLTVLFFELVHANSLKIAVERNAPLIGGSSSNRDFLQSSGTRSDIFHASYFFGETNGFYFGFNYSKEYSKYTQPQTLSRPFAEFSSTFTSIGPEIGLWIQPSELIVLESGISIGTGGFKFSNSELGVSASQNPLKIDFHVGAVHPSDILGSQIRLDFFTKFGGYVVQLKEFTYNDITYTQSELELKYYIYISVGLGLRF
mgnify:CR=1 FL=1|tara:strand:+ start:6777 stop:7403 length:627 start_codon:yes stop_codon:yes gene_type:complete